MLIIIIIIGMVKFFMQGGKGTKVEKKPTDYRLIVYKEFMGVIKTKHLKYISRIVKSLKENAEMNQCEKEQKEGLLEGYKSIKKGEMKILSMYLMVKYLNITNFNVVEKFTKSTVPEVGQIVSTVESSKDLTNFFNEISKSKIFQTVLEKNGGLCDNISRKKHQAKEKSKERKMRKMLEKQNRRSKV